MLKGQLVSNSFTPTGWKAVLVHTRHLETGSDIGDKLRAIFWAQKYFQDEKKCPVSLNSEEKETQS